MSGSTRDELLEAIARQVLGFAVGQFFQPNQMSTAVHELFRGAGSAYGRDLFAVLIANGQKIHAARQ
jgi:hypothetical protein